MDLLDLLNEYLDGSIECEIYDFASSDILWTGDVYGAAKKFYNFETRDGVGYRVASLMEIDNYGKLYIPVEVM